MPAADVMEALQKEETADDDTNAIHNEIAYWDGIRETVNHWSGALGEARGCLSAFADPAPAKSLFFGVEPVQATVDFTKDVGLDTVSNGRSIYVYQPALVNDDALIAKCLKATFFEAVLASPDRRDRGSKMPLVFTSPTSFIGSSLPTAATASKISSIPAAALGPPVCSRHSRTRASATPSNLRGSPRPTRPSGF